MGTRVISELDNPTDQGFLRGRQFSFFEFSLGKFFLGNVLCKEFLEHFDFVALIVHGFVVLSYCFRVGIDSRIFKCRLNVYILRVHVVLDSILDNFIGNLLDCLNWCFFRGLWDEFNVILD